MLTRADKVRVKGKYIKRGVGVVRDQQIKLELIASHTVGGAGEGKTVQACRHRQISAG
jgi:hypothetical protein